MSNYMVATADSCRNHFTPGQVNYMQTVIRQYKPTLMKQLLPSCVAAIDSSDYSPDLQPCLAGTVKLSASGRRFCKTDPDDENVWAWACCPESLNWNEQECWQGTPNFNLPREVPEIPRVGTISTKAPTKAPTDSAATLTRAPTPKTRSPTRKTKSPTKNNRVTQAPSSSPTRKTKAPTPRRRRRRATKYPTPRG